MLRASKGRYVTQVTARQLWQSHDFARYHATKHPKAPTVTSIVPSILVRVIGKLKKGSGVDPNRGKTNRSVDSHNKPPIRRNPNNLISKSTRRESFCPGFLVNNSSRAIELAVLLTKSDKTKPKRKCSSISSSGIIQCKNRKSRKTSANSKNPAETILLSSKIALTMGHIFLLMSYRYN